MFIDNLIGKNIYIYKEYKFVLYVFGSRDILGFIYEVERNGKEEDLLKRNFR